MIVFTSTFVNSFDENLGNNKLYNLVFGSTVNEDIAQNYLFMLQTGLNLMQAFKPRLNSLNAAHGFKASWFHQEKCLYNIQAKAVKAKIQVSRKSLKVLLHLLYSSKLFGNIIKSKRSLTERKY